MERLWIGGVGRLVEAGVVVLLALVLHLQDGVHQGQIVISSPTAGEVLLLLRQVEETSGTNGQLLKVSSTVCAIMSQDNSVDMFVSVCLPVFMHQKPCCRRIAVPNLHPNVRF